MEKLSSDLLFSLAIHLDLYEILNFCSTNKEIDRKVCKNIWNYKLNEIEDQESVEKLRNGMKPKKLYELVYSLIKVKNFFKLEDNIYDLYNRKELNFYNIGITEIPKELANLTNLKRLYLHNNKISEIPKELGNLTNLNYLYLHNNKISEIPKELGNLSNLKYLNLYNNKITEIPTELCNLPIGL